MEKDITMSQAYKTMFRDYPEVVGVKDISKMLSISPKRVRQLAQDNKIPRLPDSRTILVAKIYIIDYVLYGSSSNEAEMTNEAEMAVAVKR